MGDVGYEEAGEGGYGRLEKGFAEAGPPYGCPLVLRVFAKASTALKNADHLLSDVMAAVDTDGDGCIQYNGQQS